MAVFEAPAAHEGAHYSPELEEEWETHETHYSQPYSTPEMEEETHETHFSSPYSTPEAEWETHETHYSQPYSTPEMEWETHETHFSNPYSTPEMEEEWETHETHYSSGEAEAEFLGNILSSIGRAAGLEAEDYSSPEFEGEFEDEGEFFFKRLKRLTRRIGSALGPIAKRLAPFAARALAGMIPGVGAIAGPLAGKLVGALVREAEMEVGQLEAELFGSNELEAEVGHTETAHEAALTELLAAEASQASNESEAESVLAATLPITITIMGGRRALRPVMPTLTQANARLVKTLGRQGPAGRQLLRTVPSIQRRTVATLRAASRSGRPITGPLAVRAMAAATQSVLNNPRRVQRIVERNLVLRRRVAPPSPRRAAVFVPNRVPPYHPRRAAGYRPMSATPRT